MQPADVIAGRYEIIDVAGRGGMGTVYRARQRNDGTTVAVKVLDKSSGGDVRRLGREISVLASLQHPNIVGYRDHGVTSGGEHYLVMEWVGGESLQARIGRAVLSVTDTVALCM